MCARPSQKQSVGSCLSLRLSLRAARTQAQPAGRPMLPSLTQTASAALDGTVLVIGNSTLSGRAFSVWLWLRATSEAIGQTALGGTPVLCVCLGV